jgi:predicted phosphoribosyltransferase
MAFRDRREAGQRLAKKLAVYRGTDCLVLALPRGGVPVAAEIAQALAAPLDLLMVRKIGAPAHPEFAVGAVVDGPAPLVVEDAAHLAMTRTAKAQFDAICARELKEIERRRALYLKGRPPAPLRGRTVILVDDGLATGSTMRVALAAVRRQQPARVVMAVPVAPKETLEALAGEADQLVCLETPEPFGAVGYFYENFAQVDDAEVIALLAAHGPAVAGQSGART